jgi:hypothetical protein
MADTHFDILVLGNSPLALLLAGLFADRYRRKVCLAAEPLASAALPRGLDLSVAPVTRPQSWAMATRGVVETRALLAEIGAAAGIEPCEPILVGSGATTLEALQHMRHVAIGHGHRVERVADTDIGAGSVGYRFADAVRLDRSKLLPRLGAWLAELGVTRLVPPAGAVVLRNDGSSRLATGAGQITADRTVFADEQAIVSQLAADRRDGLLQIDPGRAVLTEPARSLPASLMVYLDRGASLAQAADGSITALMAGAPDTALGRLGGCLSAQGMLRRAGEAGFLLSGSADGAPIIGPVRGSRAIMAAALGPWGAFLAPALARWLEARSEGTEAEWFAAHAPQRGSVRTAFADFCVPRCLEATP